MDKKKESESKTINKYLFCIALVCIILSGIVGIVSADTSVAWTKDIGDVTAADMSEDGSVIYAAVGSQIFVYDAAGVQQNTFTVGGNVVKLVCTADGSKASLYTGGNEVYYIDSGALTWTQSFTAITDIDISNAGNVLIVEGTQFHKYLSDGSLEYDSASGTYNLGVIDPSDEFAIVQSGTSGLQKYILTTTDQYWAKVGDNSFNTNFSGYQNLLILYTNETSAIILSNTTLGDELWNEIYAQLGSKNKYYAVSDESLIQTNAYNYELSLGDMEWESVTSSAAWSARRFAAAWVYNDLMWIGGGSGASSTYYNDVWYSSDGQVWTQATSSAAWSKRQYAATWVYNDLMWIGGGGQGSTVYNDVWYSSDGQVWTQATSSATWPKRSAAATWVYNDLMWIGGGGQGSTVYNDVWYSSDGQVWTQAASSAAWSARYDAATWVYNDLMWIGGGASLPTFYNDVWYSSDGVVWTQAESSAAWSARYSPAAWVYNDLMWIGGGISSGDVRKNDVWYSSDGVVWTQAESSAAWSARFGMCNWIYNDAMWIGGGYIAGSPYFTRDVWSYSLQDISLIIQPSSTGQTWLFYNYQGDSPQHTQTTYVSSVDFTGTTELRTKPELSIYQHQASKTVIGAIESISVSDTGDWVGTATSTRIYHDQITSSGFGTEYYATLGSTGTVYDVATANGAAMSVVGQGQTTDIYSMSVSRVGTYTAGGAVNHVDIADKNALWAASGGEDGKVYIFSKDASSNWYLEYSSDSENPITALRMSARGEYILAGRTNSLTLYQTNTPVVTQTDFWFTLYAYKDSDSYRNAAVNVSVYSGNQWNSFAQGLTDTAGKYVVQLTAGQTYKFDVGNGQKMLVYMATPSVTSQTISIYTSPVSSALTYDAVWDTDIGGISFDYKDSSGQTQSVNVKIQRTDTWETVYDQTFTGQQDIEENLPIIDDTTTYKVELSASRSTGVTRNIFFVSSSRDIVPIPLDQNIKNVLFSGLLMVIAGLFSYLSAIRGAVVVGFAAMFFVYLGWLTIPWHWAIIAVVIAIVAGFTQRRT